MQIELGVPLLDKTPHGIAFLFVQIVSFGRQRNNPLLLDQVLKPNIVH